MQKRKDLHLQAFAATLRTQRRRRGFSQEQLALEGISRGHVSDMERGIRDPKLTMLYRICELLGVKFGAFAAEIDRHYERLKEKNEKTS